MNSKEQKEQEENDFVNNKKQNSQREDYVAVNFISFEMNCCEQNDNLKQLNNEFQIEEEVCKQQQNKIFKKCQKKKKQLQINNKKNKQICKIKENKCKKYTILDVLGKVCEDETIRLAFGIQIQKDGIIRYSYSVSHFSFGFSFYNYISVNYMKQSSLIEIDLSVDLKKPKSTVKQAISFISHTPCKKMQQAQQALQRYDEIKENEFRQMFINNINSYSQYEQKTCQFIESCKEYISEYSYQNPTQIYQYAIGRVNYDLQDVQIVKLGYSKSFLDLIGIDVQNFTNILLRHQKIDLMPDKEEIMEHSLQGLYFSLSQQQELEYDCSIVTFDGFPLRVSLKKRWVQPSCQSRQMNVFVKELFLSISEIDINVEDLQNLIIYRQNILNGTLSFDEYIQKELSFTFEDVEYSVLSQSFIEKYYSNNIIQLKKIQQKYEQNNQCKALKQCDYKCIDTNHLFINKIQIISSQ